MNGAETEEPFVSPFAVYRAKQVLTLPPVPFRVQGIGLPERGLGMIPGPSGHGKGLLIQDLAISLARGTQFRGELDVAQCAVCILASEGWSGYPGRQRAVYQHHGIAADEDVPLFYIAASPQLDDPMMVEQVMQTLRAMLPRPRVLFVDTYRATNSGDENSSTDVARYVAHLKLLEETIQGFVCVAAHVPWTAERERGSTAMRAAMDWVAMVMKEDDVVTLSCLKSKDGPEFKPMRWRIEARADSATVIPLGDKEQAVRLPRQWAEVPSSAQKLLTVLAEAFGDDGATSGNLQKASRVPETSFFRTIKRLTSEWGLVEKKGTRYLLTPAGRVILP